MWRLATVVSGVAALVGAVLVTPSPLLPVHRFAPSTAQLAAARQMAWNSPRQCSPRIQLSGDPDQIISRADNDTLFTLYSGNYVQVDATR
jgi:hypothetical protein